MSSVCQIQCIIYLRAVHYVKIRGGLVLYNTFYSRIESSPHHCNIIGEQICPEYLCIWVAVGNGMIIEIYNYHSVILVKTKT